LHLGIADAFQLGENFMANRADRRQALRYVIAVQGQVFLDKRFELRGNVGGDGALFLENLAHRLFLLRTQVVKADMSACRVMKPVCRAKMPNRIFLSVMELSMVEHLQANARDQ